MRKARKHEKTRYGRLISKLELAFPREAQRRASTASKIHARKLYFVGHCDSPARPPSKLPARR